MTASEFWDIIEIAHHRADGNQEAQMEAVEHALEQLEPGQMLEFQASLAVLRFGW